MKFKSPKMENLTGALVVGGSAVAGAAASNLLVAKAIGKPSGDAKKDGNKRKMVKGGAVVVAVLGLACVDGNDTGANAVRGALIGMAGTQGISLAKEMTDPSKAGETTKEMLGLGCPCQGQDGLRSPEWFDYSPTYEDYNYTPYQEVEEVKQARNPLVGFTPRESYV